MNQVEIEYRTRYSNVLFTISESLSKYLQGVLEDEVRIDRISTRPKSVERFMGKANATIGDRPKYVDPLHQIQDQIGARIITFVIAHVALSDC